MSNNKDALVIMSGFGENFIYQLAQVLIKYRDNLTILVRAAYVLGNLTTDFQESWQVIIQKRLFPALVSNTIALMEQDMKP